MTMAKERIHEIGYINDDRQHVLISIHNPAILPVPHDNFVQFAITIDGAIELRAHLNAFLDAHGLVSH